MQNPHFVNLKDPLGNIISGPFNTIPGNSDIIQLNHYYTRSMEDSYEKQNRGRTDCLQSYEIPHLHELDNNIKDDMCANKYLEVLKSHYNIININYEIYRDLNPDLKSVLSTSSDYYEHLYVCGLSENRPKKITDKYPNFVREYYRKNYVDLQNLNDLELEKHYINTGVNEGRICNTCL